jgi:hypothetical protein
MPRSATDRARFLLDPVEFQKYQLCRRLWTKQKEILRFGRDESPDCRKGVSCFRQDVRRRRAATLVASPASGRKGIHNRADAAPGQDVLERHFGRPLKWTRQAIASCTSTGLDVGPSRYAFGASSSAGVNIQGLHGSDVLIIADEAPGIDSDIWDAIEGIRAGGKVHVLELGNPVIPSGHFYDSFTRNRAIYNYISISAFDTPDLQHPDGRPITEEELLAMTADELAYQPFPSLITREWVQERLQIWGRKHPKYIARVLGEFPSDDPASVFPLSWIERAQREPTDAEQRELARMISAGSVRVQVGIDVAGAGADETVLTARVGGIILEQHCWSDADPRGPVLAALGRLSIGKIPLGTIVVDTVAIGYNFAHHLVDHGFACYGFNAGARPIDATQFVNQKAEAHWTFRTYLQENVISGLTDEETAAQLSTIRYPGEQPGADRDRNERSAESAGDTREPGSRRIPHHGVHAGGSAANNRDL